MTDSKPVGLNIYQVYYYYYYLLLLMIVLDFDLLLPPRKKVRKLHGGSLTYPCLIPSLSTSVSLLYPTCIHASIYFFIYYPPTQSTFKSLKKKWAKNLPQHWRHGINYQQLMYRNKFYLMEGGILENSATNSLFYHQSLFHILINIALWRLNQPQIF